MRKGLLTLGLAGGLAFSAGCGITGEKNEVTSEHSELPAACLTGEAISADKLTPNSDYIMTKCVFIGRAVFGEYSGDNPDFVQITFENQSNQAELGCVAVINGRSDAGTNLTCNWDAYNSRMAMNTTTSQPR